MLWRSTVTLGHFFNFFLLLQSVAGLNIFFLHIDDFVSEALSDSLLGLMRLFSCSLSNQIDGLVDSSQRGNVDSLLSDHTACSDTGGVFTGSSLENSVNKHFQWVSACQQVNNFKSMSHNPDGLHFFTSISAVELHWTHKSFNDRAEGFSEFFGLISASCVGNEHLRLGGFDCNIVDEAWVFNLSDD